MRSLLSILLLAFSSLAPAQQDAGKGDALRALAWQRGSGEGRIADKASIQIPQGYVFLDAPNTKRFLEIAGNPPRDGHYMIAPETLSWFAVFSFNPVGYVKDDEKINPDELLKSLQVSDASGNEERKRLGLEALHTDGWQVAPHYDTSNKRLEWGVRIRTDRGEQVVNYTSRLLGRTGVMNAVLVSDPRSLSADTAQFKTTLAGFNFAAGEKYAEFKAGDKVAEYGLAALVVGGAAAAAAKSGLLKSLGKFLWVIIGGALAGIWGIAKRIFGRKTDPNVPQ
jgi:uncharacterized membrane-anchored protein